MAASTQLVNSRVESPSLYVAASKLHFLDLPVEILSHIISFLFPEEIRNIDVTVQRRIRGFTWGNKWRGCHYPEFQQFSNLVHCSRKSRDLVLQYFEMHNCFFSDNTEGLQRLAKGLDVQQSAMIRKFEVRMDDFTKNNDETVFPRIIQVFCNCLPSLTTLKLSAWSPKDSQRCFNDKRDRAKTVTRQQQEVRAVLRLLVFLVKYHPLLKRLIWPASRASESSEDFSEIENSFFADSGRRRRWDIVETSVTTEPNTSVIYEDEILNATALSRLQWDELAHINAKDFVVEPVSGQLKADITNSNFPDRNGYYAILDERAYLSKSHHRARGWKYRDVDALIRKCREVEAEMNSIEGQKRLVRGIFEQEDFAYRIHGATLTSQVRKGRSKKSRC